MSTVPIHIVKLGGDVVDDTTKRQRVFAQLQQLGTPFLLVHGGGKVATQLSEQLGVMTQMIEGRRITDAETLRIVTMVYAGLINKGIVAELQSLKLNAIGLSGVDADLLRAHKRDHSEIDYGFVGDIDTVQTSFLLKLLNDSMIPVIAPLTHDGAGQLLNTNADSVTTRIACALAEHLPVRVLMLMDKAGVLHDVEDAQSLIAEIDPTLYQDMRARGAIHTGMIAKLDNAFELAEHNIDVLLCSWRDVLHGTRVVTG